MERRPKASEVASFLLSQALDGDEGAMTRLVDLWTPIIQARVVRTLLRGQKPLPPGQARQMVEDLTQEVFLNLFENGSRVIRTWDPEKGLSLENFVGLVAERKVSNILRSPKRNPWTEEPAQPEVFERSSGDSGPESQTQAKQRLRQLLHRFKSELTPLGWQLFELLFLRELSIKEIGIVTELSPEAIYAWRSRLRRQARKFAEERDRRPNLERYSHG